ncbi:MAG TPA: (d)CMP kinase [Patescibacteria group bacterium]|nr:(d)CMP kinase [Patescibacteria group bacterium]
MNGYAIAIDGPVAAGKGTIAALIAKKLHGFHLYTGAMYRGLTLYCLQHNIPVSDKEKVLVALQTITFTLDNATTYMNGEDITERIKKRDVTQSVAKVAAISQVRQEMVKRQRSIAKEKMEKGFVVIAEARDAATRILPDAFLKIYLTATPEVRAKRRYEQMGGKQNTGISFEQMLKDTKERDYRDTHREADPLVLEPEKYGYFVLDDSNLSEEETVEKILKEIERRKQ